jgi:hypothetical protein
MRGVLRALVVLQVLAPLCTVAADESILLELNSVESADNRCRVNLVFENKSTVGIPGMKLDLVAFGADGGILQRFLVEVALRPAKTMVRSVLFDAECRQLGAILVNDVTACAPLEPGACLDALTLSSRIKTLRLHK